MASVSAFGSSSVFGPKWRRLFNDPHVLLGIAIALSATSIEAAESGQTIPVALAGIAYVCLQVFVASRRGLRHPIPRLLVALGLLFALGLVGGPAHAVPLTLLALPIVATAARNRPASMDPNVRSTVSPTSCPAAEAQRGAPTRRCFARVGR